MFVKLTRSGGHTYAQLVESFRDESGKPRQRTITTLGRVDENGGQVDALLSTLLRAKGHSAEVTTPQIKFESPMATSNSPTRGHPKFPQARRPDYDGSGLMARRAAASLRR